MHECITLGKVRKGRTCGFEPAPACAPIVATVLRKGVPSCRTLIVGPAAVNCAVATPFFLLPGPTRRCQNMPVASVNRPVRLCVCVCVCVCVWCVVLCCVVLCCVVLCCVFFCVCFLLLICFGLVVDIL